ncbi:MAG: response regulator [Lachnospiraceae bacterium]|nr:response regulator [Lachnospiraceae bacterium]
MYTVLLVDDEPVALAMEKKIIKKYLEKFEVIGEKFSVATAMEFYKEFKPDVVLTDIRMPAQTGVELIRYISEHDDKGCVCIAISGYTDFKYVRNAFAYGAMDYLQKPIEAEKMIELFGRIESVLEKKGPRLPVKDESEYAASERVLVERICKYLDANISEDNSIVMVCSRFGITQPYLSRIFKNCLNYTYNQYLTELRILKAKEHLQKKRFMRISEVAGSVGYQDPLYFSKVFKNITGYTPREYKNSLDQDE